MHNQQHPSSAATPAEPAPQIELLPPSFTMRVGNRRLTLCRRPRKSMPLLLSGLLRRSWRAMFGASLRISLAAAAVCAAWNAPALAAAPAAGTLPTGGSVTYGNATFSQSGNTLTVNQTSSQAIANFTTFSIGANATVNISQPSAAASFLARVTGTDPSLIYGLLKSNGTVALINQNGILVGPGGVVDVARFIASTLNISDSDFLAGRLTFTNQGSAGMVENQGTITSASGGSVYLIGSNVSNSGVIKSPNGEILLAAGQTVQLVDTGTPGVTVNVTGAAGNVTNLGELSAEAGRIGIAAGLINNSGNINASSVVADGGRIFLRASQKLTTSASSSITADGADNGGSVVLYSAGAAYLDGVISALGGSGTGGYVETSGLTSLDVVKAPTVGVGGTWYIDPYDLTVVADTSADMNTVNVTSCNSNVITSNGSSSYIRASEISGMLTNGTNVTLATGAGGDASGGNITIDAAIVASGNSNVALTLNADNNININANITSTTRTLDLNLNVNNNDAVAGAHEVALTNSTISLNGGALSIHDGSNGGTGSNGNLSMYNGVLNLSSNIVACATYTKGGSLYAGNVTLDTNSSIVGGGWQSTVNITGTLNNSGSVLLSSTGAGSYEIGEIVNSGLLSLSNMTLEVGGAIINSGIFNVTNSTVSTELANNGGGEEAFVVVTGATDFTNTEQGTVNVYYGSNFYSVINNYGVMAFNSTTAPNGFEGHITLHSGLTNYATGSVNVVGQLVNTGIIVNNGNFTLAAGASIVGTEVGTNQWYNNANLTLAAGSSISGGDFYNTGSISMTDASLSVTKFENQQGSTLSGTGTIDLGGGILLNDGVLAPGGDGVVGTLAINGGYTQQANGSLMIDIASNTSYDMVLITAATYTLGGTLQTRLLGSYVPTLNGVTFTPIASTSNIESISGYFRHVYGDVINVSGSLEMVKARYGSSGLTLQMLGSEDITYTGGEGGWGSSSSWSTGYLPTAVDNVIINGSTLAHYASDGLDIVNNITIGGSGGLDLGGGTIQVNNLTSTGNVFIENFSEGGVGGNLSVAGSAQMSTLYLYSGATITGGASSLIGVDGYFQQSGGAIVSAGDVVLRETEGTELAVGNITARNLVLNAVYGSITQSIEGAGLTVTKQLITASSAGTNLSNSANVIAAYAGVNNDSGDITLVNNLGANVTQVAYNGVINKAADGNIDITNYGAAVTSAMSSDASSTVVAQATALGVTTSGLVDAVHGNLSLVTHSPLTIGIAGVTASGGIILKAGDGTSASDILIVNGAIASTNGDITLFGNSLTLNANVSTTGNTLFSVTNGVITYAPGVSITNASGTVIPVAVAVSVLVPTVSSGTSSSSSGSPSSQQVSNSTSSATNSIISSVTSTKSTDSTTTPSGTTSGSSSSSSSASSSYSSSGSMTTGGSPGTFGGDDPASDSDSSSGSGSGSGAKSSGNSKKSC